MREMIFGVIVVALLFIYAIRRSFSSYKDAGSCAGCSLNCPSKTSCPSTSLQPSVSDDKVD